MNEEEIVARIKDGDEDAFRELYDHYGRLVYRYVHTRVGNTQDAEDLTSETFIRAWKSFSNFKWQGKPVGAWLMRIAHNLIVDKYRKKRDVVSWAPWLTKTEEPRFAQIDQQDQLRQGLAELSHDQQVILYLRFFEGYKLVEIAEYIGKTPNAVRVAQHRALNKLQELLS